MKVNFVSEITAFYRWIKSNHISTNAQILWFHLFCLWNEAGFPDWLQVDTLRMMGMVQMKSKNTLIRTRDELVNAGLMISKRGKNKTPNKYQFVLFCGSKNEPQTGTETGCETGTETVCETGRLYKLNQTKPNLIKEKTVYGDYGNVLLTDVELSKLQDEYPDSWDHWIKRLDVGKELKNYQYTNDYAAIKSWIENKEKEETDKVFEELMQEAALMLPVALPG